MRIRMLETRRDTEDGFVLRELRKGEEYDLREFLTCRLLAAGRAEAVENIPQPPTEE